jgi:hydroxymethylbilane synthase
LKDLPAKTVVATSSTRRNKQLLAAHPDLHIVEIRGNVATRLQKVARDNGLDATVLALAGLRRLNYQVSDDGKLIGPDAPEGLLAMILDLDVMLPCVGQGAIGIEIRADGERSAEICERLNHPNTLREVTAERAFLRGMGGGCLSPVAAYAEIAGERVSLRAVSFQGKTPRRGEAKRPIAEAALLGEQMAAALK